MGVISVRIPDEAIESLRRADIKVADIVREEVLKLARHADVRRRMAVLDKHRGPASDPGKTAADYIRELREERDARLGR